jgi:hypothetical protein
MDFSKLRRMESPPDEAGDKLEAIIKVRVPGYVPPHVRMRARVDDLLFTAEFSRKALRAIESDPKVASVQASQPLRIIE